MKEILRANGIEYLVIHRRKGEVGIYVPKYSAKIPHTRDNENYLKKVLPNFTMFKPRSFTSAMDMAEEITEMWNRLKSSEKGTTRSERVKAFAEENRNNPTPAEKRFKAVLDEAKIEYRFNEPVGCYIPDFRIGDLIVEVDGEYHFTKEQREKDERRTKFLTKLGYTVVRITNEDVFAGNFPPLIKSLMV